MERSFGQTIPLMYDDEWKEYDIQLALMVLSAGRISLFFTGELVMKLASEPSKGKATVIKHVKKRLFVF